MEQVTLKPDEVRRDIAIQFSQKNRSMDYAPREYDKHVINILCLIRQMSEFKTHTTPCIHTADKHRVPLKGEHPDYINAVFINVSYKSYTKITNVLVSTFASMQIII